MCESVSTRIKTQGDFSFSTVRLLLSFIVNGGLEKPKRTEKGRGGKEAKYLELPYINIISKYFTFGKICAK